MLSAFTGMIDDFRSNQNKYDSEKTIYVNIFSEIDNRIGACVEIHLIEIFVFLIQIETFNFIRLIYLYLVVLETIHEGCSNEKV